MALKPVRTELFRFVSLRSTQLIDPTKKYIFFVHHPAPDASHFLAGLNEEDLEVASKELRAKVSSFQPIRSKRILESKYTELYRFSLWLSRHKKQLSATRLEAKAKQLNPLARKEILFIWDQLFYQLLEKPNPTLRQACTNLLVANHFISIIKDEDILDLAQEYYEGNQRVTAEEEYTRRFIRRLANAKIIVPREFSKSREDGSANDNLHQPSKPQAGPSPERRSGEILELGNTNAVSLYNYREFTAVKNDMRKHLTTPGVRTMKIEEALKEPKISLSKRTRDHLELRSKQAEQYYRYYQKANNRILDENRIYRDTKQLLRNLPNDAVDDYCYLFKLDMNRVVNTLTFSIKFPRVSVKIETVQISLKHGNRNLASTNTLAELLSESLIKTYNVFPDTLLQLRESVTFKIKGKIVLSDQRELQIDAEISVGDNIFNSCTNKPDEAEPVEDKSPTLYGVNRIGMGIFRRVEQEVCCYVPGEISHIENIMAREYKERSTRNFSSTEEAVVSTQDFEVETSTDTATTTRNEIQKAVSEVLSKNSDLGLGASAGVEGNTGYGKFSANANFGFAMTNAAANSDTEATTFAQDITTTAAERVLQKTTEKRTSKVVREFEEKIRHGYDNRDGDEHVTGIYRWIDIIYTNRLINYGAMEMVEFLIPEPSRFYKETILGVQDGKDPNNESDQVGSANTIKSLEELGIRSPQDIKAYHNEDIKIAGGNTVGNYYQELANYYGVTINGPMAQSIEQNIPLVDSGLDHQVENTGTGSEQITDGYELAELAFSGQFVHNPGNDSNPSMFSISAAGRLWDIELPDSNINTDVFTYNVPRIDADFIERIRETYRKLGVPLPDKTVFEIDNQISGLVTANLTAHRTVSYNVNVKLTSEITPEALLDWKTEAFETLVEAYEVLVAQEEQAALDEGKEKEEELASLATGNTALNRRIEIRELKRAAIEMITRPFGKKKFIGRDFLDYGQCDVNFPRQNEAWEKYSSHVKFFEQAFEWEIMAYIFYPYFWASRCSWKNLLKAEDPNDHIFEAFLQSGMARMVLPVRRGFENAVNYYFETGEIWNGGDLVLDTDDELYLSIDEELEEPEGNIEEEWETRVPTTLTLIQGDSAYLQGEGLPCCDDVDHQEEEQTGITKSTALLGVVKEG